ncbi:ROK family transcriptional regulator [Devosia rhizoryzae]|uniref:ROK family transcriptional regulator n=1 Tax=Devosia rhizoryzae TaxID=2774137 RepID=A0ABX7C3E9_9HYPH|nr:ROK family transcriptional regulator [Devosia rhizoryzae]QQR38765.1 ROK family transcriptional regulator [Devosia rhizoryzae]
MTASNEPTRDIFDTGGRGVRHQGLRRANEKAVLTVIGFNTGVSNAEISRLSGLAPQTVSAILVDLEQSGLIERGEVLRGRRGQPATPIQLRASGAFGIGVELSWTHLDAVLIDMHANVLRHQRIEYLFPDASTIFTRIAEIVSELTSVLSPAERERLLDLGLAMPGRLAENLELVGAPPEQEVLWRGADPVALLHDATGLEVTILNDGNAACWAELIALERPRPANVLYFLVSRYVAAGIVGDGALWEGPTGNGANLGSMLVQFDGSGPREAHFMASAWALEQKRTEAHAEEDGDLVTAWIDQSARTLARVAFNAMTVVESPLLVIDTVLGAEITKRLAERLVAELAALPVRGFNPPRVVCGVHGKLAPAIGAAELPMFRRYF